MFIVPLSEDKETYNWDLSMSFS